MSNQQQKERPKLFQTRNILNSFWKDHRICLSFVLLVPVIAAVTNLGIFNLDDEFAKLHLKDATVVIQIDQSRLWSTGNFFGKWELTVNKLSSALQHQSMYHFRLKKYDSGFVILSSHTGMAWTETNDEELIIGNPNGKESQRFRIVRNFDGTFSFQSVLTKRWMVCPDDASRANRFHLKLQTREGNFVDIKE
jgi:hypothetical protein